MATECVHKYIRTYVVDMFVYVPSGFCLSIMWRVLCLLRDLSHATTNSGQTRLHNPCFETNFVVCAVSTTFRHFSNLLHTLVTMLLRQVRFTQLDLGYHMIVKA